MNSTSRPAIAVVLDSNVWVSSSMLQTSTGRALLHILRKADGTIGMPEVVRKETPPNVVAKTEKLIDQSQKGIEEVARLMGVQRDISFPNGSELEARIAQRFDDLGFFLREVPITIDHVRSALDRVITRLPPTQGKREEFRDSLVWEGVLEMAQTYPRVLFVTEDTDYFQDGIVGRGPAENLLNDCMDADGEVEILSSLKHASIA